MGKPKLAPMTVLPALVALASGLLSAAPPQALRTLERGLEARLLRLRGARPVPESVVLVAIDDSTLQQGAWFADPSASDEQAPSWAQGIHTLPWPRARYGDLLDRLQEAEPAAVALNLVFEGASMRGSADDAALAGALARMHGRVALAAEILNITDTGFSGLSLVQPPQVLLRAAGPDSVGLTNLLPPLSREASPRHPEAFSRSLDNPVAPLLRPSLPLVLLERAGRRSRQPDAERTLNFYGPEGHFVRLPAWEVLDPQRWRNHSKRNLIRGSLVLVGPVVAQGGTGTPTPFGTFSGLELLATATANSLQGDGLRFWPDGPLARGLLAAAPVLMVALLARLRGALRWRLAVVAAGVAVLFGIAFLALLWSHTWIPLLVPASALVLLGLLDAGGAYLAEERERRRLRRTFERYVAPSVVAEILSDPADAEGMLRGRLLPVTILFSDIKGFTQLTNRRSRNGEIELHVRQLNRYLAAMVEVITAHGGTIDKFIGDAVMAVFGSPVSRGVVSEAQAALRCAQEMRRELRRLNQQWAEEGCSGLDSGIGLASGEVLVGQIGSPRRMEFTVIGDKVNLASRMEGLTRTLDVAVLFDAATAALVGDAIRVRPLGQVPVKGMDPQPVFTCEVVPVTP
jgi:adenylate cyclase